ncbi:hypothetical protein EDD85DRAFT_956479 [Armillaria nabsnona]|nr:hypothetical protein EDD85DRAFT_956479 [Armillaria nabsnona]
MSDASRVAADLVLTVGPLVLGACTHQIFLGVILFQFLSYLGFRGEKNRLCLTIIIVLLSLNLSLGMCNIYTIYRSVVLHYGDVTYLDFQTWIFCIEPALAAAVALIAQVASLIRYWRLTKARKVVLLLSTVIFFAFAAGAIVSMLLMRQRRLSYLSQLWLPVALWLLATGVANIALSSAWIVQIRRSQEDRESTGTVLSRGVHLLIETLPAVLTLINFLLFLSMRRYILHCLLIQFCLSHIYTISIMAALIAAPGSLSSILSPTPKCYDTFSEEANEADQVAGVRTINAPAKDARPNAPMSITVGATELKQMVDRLENDTQSVIHCEQCVGLAL